MTVRNLKKLESAALADNRITRDEADNFVKSTSDWFGVSKAEKSYLESMLSRDADKFEPAAREALEKFLGLSPAPTPAPRPAPAAEVISTRLGPDSGSLSDDAVYFGKDGTFKSGSGVTPWTRSYDAVKEGVLRTAHGSRAPSTTVAGELARTPGAALDEAASAFGTTTSGFENMAGTREFYDTSAQYWEGKCHAWTWSSLSSWIDSKVDVDGPSGQRGLWVGGQWISRADLGDWMMAVADQISINDREVMFAQHPGAEELVKAVSQFMVNKGGGVIADVYNDKKHGDYEVWNQPFVSAQVDAKTLPGGAAAAILARARADGASTGTTVKLAQIAGTYGVEASDDYEGASNQTQRNWSVYVVTDAGGKMVKAYMADDDALKGISGLPTTTTDELPDYFWKPSNDAVNAAINGARNPAIDSDPLGPQFRFFVGTVLGKGVPGTVRTAFEKELAALPAGAITSARAAELSRKYSGVANAYSPDQWKTAFAARGLDAKAFGAAW